MTLGFIIVVLPQGTPLIVRYTNRYATMPYTARVLLLALRNNYYVFILDNIEYLIHADNIP